MIFLLFCLAVGIFTISLFTEEGRGCIGVLLGIIIALALIALLGFAVLFGAAFLLGA